MRKILQVFFKIKIPFLKDIHNFEVTTLKINIYFFTKIKRHLDKLNNLGLKLYRRIMIKPFFIYNLLYKLYFPKNS
jgi:hypothetical protein